MNNNVSKELKFAYTATICAYDNLACFLYENPKHSLHELLEAEMCNLHQALIGRGVRKSLVMACVSFFENRFRPALKIEDLDMAEQLKDKYPDMRQKVIDYYNQFPITREG